jgi:hypothetical protein
MFQRITEYHAPRWPDPAYPQQLHLDVTVDCPVSAKSALSHLNRPIMVLVSIKAPRCCPVSVDLACCADVEVAEAGALTLLCQLT